MYSIKKRGCPTLDSLSSKKAATYSPTYAVPSALMGLTTLFGMVRGEPHRYNHLKSLFRDWHRTNIFDMIEINNNLYTGLTL